MFGMFRHRDERSQASSGDYLISFLSMNRGGRGLSPREKLAVARRIDTAPPLDNPLTALDVSAPVSESTPAAAAQAFILPVSAPTARASQEQSAPAAGGISW